MAAKTDKEPVRIGADPEVFVFRDGKIVPVCGLVGGTKDNPIKVDIAQNKKGMIGSYAYQEDNVAFEFNIPACSRGADFVDAIRRMRQWMSNFLAEKGLEWRNKAAQKFTANALDHPLAQVIGCNPDMWAYKQGVGYERQAFNIKQLGNYRYCGGHIHLGYDRKAIPPNIMAQLVDLLITIPHLRFDKQGPRRQFYGLPGVYREKPYGIEYRTFSNFWLQDGFELGIFAECFFELMNMVQDQDDGLVRLYQTVDWGLVERTITNESTKDAADLCNQVDAYFGSVGLASKTQHIQYAMQRARSSAA